MTSGARSPAIGCWRASELVAALLDVERDDVEVVVGVDERLAGGEVAAEERLGPPRDGLETRAARRTRSSRMTVELVVEARGCRVTGVQLTAPRRQGGRGRR